MYKKKKEYLFWLIKYSFMCKKKYLFWLIKYSFMCKTTIFSDRLNILSDARLDLQITNFVHGLCAVKYTYFSI